MFRKQKTISTQCFRSFRGGRNRDWIQSLSLGAAGGMLIAWKSDLFKLEVVDTDPTLFWLKYWILLRVFRVGFRAYMALPQIVVRRLFRWT